MSKIKTVVVTGAASGIGLETALDLARQNWRVVLLDRDQDGLQRALAMVQAVSDLGHQSVAIDLCDGAAIAALPQTVGGQIDALINNAGLSDSSGVALASRDFASLETVLALNLYAPQRLIAAFTAQFAPKMHIVNVASGAGLRAIPWRGSYSTSKAGLIAFGKSWAEANPQHQIITLSPGFIRTALVQGLIDQGRLSVAQSVTKIPLSRLGEPAEIGAMLVFLLSDTAASLHGHCLSVDGGSSIFGGTKPYEAADYKIHPFAGTPSFTTKGQHPAFGALSQGPTDGYPAHIVALAAVQGADEILAQVQRAAYDFYAQTQGPASLSLIVTPASIASPNHAATHAAMQMLVQSLACEMGPSGRRINALIAGSDLSPAALNMICGPQSQYLTGQIIPFRQRPL